MDELTEFLRARLDEDEQLAKAAAPGPWLMDELQGIYADDGAYVIAPWTEDEHDYDLDHIAHHDPARVLCEVEAKRRIIADYEATSEGVDMESIDLDHDADRALVSSLRGVVKALAAVHADHPDYRPEWSPDAT